MAAIAGTAGAAMIAAAIIGAEAASGKLRQSFRLSRIGPAYPCAGPKSSTAEDSVCRAADAAALKGLNNRNALPAYVSSGVALFAGVTKE
jgi:hypothetical protein